MRRVNRVKNGGIDSHGQIAFSRGGRENQTGILTEILTAAFQR